jgi:hypothetical protein
VRDDLPLVRFLERMSRRNDCFSREPPGLPASTEATRRSQKESNIPAP